MTERSVEHLLERCLQDLARTDDIEAVLRRYPQDAERLRPLLKAAAVATDYYANIPEPPGKLAEGRERLLATAAQQKTHTPTFIMPRKERRVKMRLIFASKLIGAVLAVVVSAATVGGGVAMAASGSLPGAPLYPAKLAIEDIRLELASTPEQQVGLALQFVDERLAEIEGLTKKEQPIPDEVVARVERHIYQAMNQAAWAPEDERPGLLERIAQRTQTQAQALERLQTQTQERNQAQLRKAQQLCQQAHEEAVNGLADPHTFRLRYQERENIPEDVTPPEPPSREPQDEGQEQDTGGAQNGQQGGNGQGDGQQRQNQNQQQEQDQQQQQQQNQNQNQQQEQDQQQQQQQNQNQQQEQDQQQQQQQNQNQQQEQDQQQQQQQNQNQQQEGDQNQQQEQNQEGSGSTGGSTSPAPPSPKN